MEIFTSTETKVTGRWSLQITSTVPSFKYLRDCVISSDPRVPLSIKGTVSVISSDPPVPLSSKGTVSVISSDPTVPLSNKGNVIVIQNDNPRFTTIP